MTMQSQSYVALFLLVLVLSPVIGALILPVQGLLQATVTIGDSFYSPQEITILVGTTVLWTNTGSLTHTSTSNTGLWDSGPIPPGGSYQSPVFKSVGVFNYHSAPPDSQITGKIIVVPTSATVLFAGTVDGGLLTGFVVAVLFAFVVIFWLNYPSAQSKARARMR
jgi:plastocyanin